MTDEREDPVLPAQEGEASAPSSAEALALAAVLREAKSAYVPDERRAGDWVAAEQRIFFRLEAERKRKIRERRSRLSVGVGFALAAAAAVLVVVRKPEPPQKPAPVAEVSRLRGGPQGTQLSSDGVELARGGELAVGRSLTARGGPVVFERAGDTPTQPRKVIWAMDPGTEADTAARVSQADTTLVVVLERGAIEADVTPVSHGEAFAVDVRGAGGQVVRIAVRGTHLRVARAGDRVTVDLTEGVIAIAARRDDRSTELTRGSKVTAPAHVEFDPDALDATLTIAPKGVRPALSLDALAEGHLPPLAEVHDPPPHTAAPLPRKPPPEIRAPVQVLSTSAARSAIAVDIKRCAVQLPHRNGVSISISSTLTLEVREDGSVSNIHADPPLSPALQDCVSKAVFPRRMEGPRVVVPVSFDL